MFIFLSVTLNNIYCFPVISVIVGLYLHRYICAEDWDIEWYVNPTQGTYEQQQKKI